MEKSVVLIFAHGDDVLKKIRKICESLDGHIYPVDDVADRRREMTLEVITRIDEVNNVRVSVPLDVCLTAPDRFWRRPRRRGARS